MVVPPKLPRVSQSAYLWLTRRRSEDWSSAALLLTLVVLLALVLKGRVHFYAGDTDGSYNRLYLLSTIAQALATILALLVTFTLVATQLAAQAYGHRVAQLKQKDKWLWCAVAIYLAAILVALWGMGILAWLKRTPQLSELSVDLALLFATTGLVYLVPFSIATFRSLQPEAIANGLMKENRYAALDDLMRKAVNEGLLTTVASAFAALRTRTETALEAVAPRDRRKAAERLSQSFVSIGRHACQRGSPDVWQMTVEHLTGLVKHCNDPRRLWRESADVFNDEIMALYDYGLEWFGGPGK
jgi:hypothetical protein